jgi:dolichyl-phosphate beta-glucosyltransferase
MTPPELALVVPCYNEAARLDPGEFLRFAATHPTVRLLMIDDGSDDGTPEILARMCAAAPASVEALRTSPRRGKAEAVRTGILAGIERRAGLVGFLDADLSTPLRAIDDFLAVFRGRPAVEFALGSRVMLLGRDVTRTMARHYLGRMFATAVSHALDLPVYDTQCGAKVLRVNGATATLFAEPFRSPWIFDVELIARYLRLPVAAGEPPRRDRLYELVVPAWHDVAGSKLRWYDFARAAVDLAHIWRERVGHRPQARTASASSPLSPARGARDGDRFGGGRTFAGRSCRDIANGLHDVLHPRALRGVPHPPGRGGVGIDARVPHVPATIQPPREVGLAQECIR